AATGAGAASGVGVDGNRGAAGVAVGGRVMRRTRRVPTVMAAASGAAGAAISVASISVPRSNWAGGSSGVADAVALPLGAADRLLAAGVGGAADGPGSGLAVRGAVGGCSMWSSITAGGGPGRRRRSTLLSTASASVVLSA